MILAVKITIKYESCWRNSFLDGSDDEPLPKKGRTYIASSYLLKRREQPENFIHRKISKSTVMGVLNRLIGDQRKLYQSRQQERYYFSDLEGQVEFLDVPEVLNQEVIYLRNRNRSTDQNSFTGMILGKDPIFREKYASELWGVLDLEFAQLCQFIASEEFVLTKLRSWDPLSVVERFEVLHKMSLVRLESNVEEAHQILLSTLGVESYLDAKEKLKPSEFYCSALYLQLMRLQKRFDFGGALTKSGGLTGISKKNFTKKNFMKPYTTGPEKFVWGNPYIKKVVVNKGAGMIASSLTKASGVLTIYIRTDKKRARDICNLIEAAGVSSFYLGKKGLAYVSEIKV